MAAPVGAADGGAASHRTVFQIQPKLARAFGHLGAAVRPSGGGALDASSPTSTANTVNSTRGETAIEREPAPGGNPGGRLDIRA